MKDSLVSVILPVYNADKYIEESIASILKQTYQEFELIIINDGSTDSSQDIIEAYKSKDSRLKVVSRENKGLVYSLNEGIALAQGKYLARMDADDISLPERLARQVTYLEENEGIDILGSQVIIFGDVPDEEMIRQEARLNRSLASENARVELLTYWYCLAHPSIMLKKSVMDRLGGYRDYKAEDLDLWLRALRQGCKIHKLNEKLLKFRLHSESKTKSDNRKYEGIKDGIRLKLDDVFTGNSLRKLDYIIWGAGQGGRITQEVITGIFPNADCTGMIDGYKTGEIGGIPIFTPDEIGKLRFDYAFVATEPGKANAISILESLGLHNIESFICTI